MWQWLCLASTLGLAAAVYWPGLGGDYAFDDEANILRNPAVLLDRFDVSALFHAALTGQAGPLKRPLSVVSFALNHIYTGLDPYYFKLTNLLIHLVNGLLVLCLVRLILRAHGRVTGTVAALRPAAIGWTALGIAAAWLLHPLQLTSVLYVVQRMTSLATLFTLLGLCAFMAGRLRMAEGRPGLGLIFCGLFGGGTLSVLAKESGFLLPLYALVCEVSFFRFRANTAGERSRLIGLFSAIFLLPVAVAAAYLPSHWELLHAGYVGRPFTITERLLTEGRILFAYLWMLVAPSVSKFSLYHDDLTVSTSLFAPISTMYALLGWVAVLIVAVAARRRAPLFCFAVFWYLAGHSLESTIIPLELMHEHRNYLPSLGPLMALFHLLFRPPVSARYVPALRTAGVLLVALYAGATWIRADQWGHPVTLAAFEVIHHPASARAQYGLGRVYAQEYYREHEQRYFDLAQKSFLAAADLDPSRQKPLLVLLRLIYTEGRQPGPGLLEVLHGRLRSQPFQMSEVQDLSALVDCVQDKACKVPSEEMQALFISAFSSPRLSDYTGSLLLTLAGTYMVNVGGNLAQAEDFMRRAAELLPDEPLPYLNLVELYLAKGDVAAAREELQHAIRLDTLGRYAQDVVKFRRRIADLRGSTPPG